MAGNQSSGAKTATNKRGNQATSGSRGKSTASSAKKSKPNRSKNPHLQIGQRTIEFPPSIAELTTRLRKRLKDLDHEIEQVEVRYQRIVRRLRGPASPIGVDVERSWRALTDPARRELAELLRRLERAIEPQLMSKRRRTAKTHRSARAA